MTKFTAVLVATLVAAVHGASLRESVQQSLELEKKNNAVCDQILNSWWPERVALKTRDTAVAMDDVCAQWNGKPDLCNFKTNRVKGSAGYDASCRMVGANNHRCLSNECNQYNNGLCSIQDTQGNCRWYTKAQVKINNDYWTKKAAATTDGTLKAQHNSNIKPGYGCYRNPCNQPGYRNDPRSDCNNGVFDVPGLFSCTWCQIKNQGMGCQATKPTTDAECAKVNQKGSQGNVYQKKDNKNCQCSIEYPQCKMEVDARSGDYVKK